MRLPEHLHPDVHPAPHSDQVITGPGWRITVLTERLLRLEWSPSEQFEDRATQVVWHRDLGEVAHEVERSGEAVRITTAALRLDYDGQPFSPGGLTVRQPGFRGWRHVWHYGDDPVEMHDDLPLGNLGGTARTLDDVDGPTPLEPGVASVAGWSTLDDTTSLALEDGWPVPRRGEPGDVDLYLFVPGEDAAAAVRDLYALTGPQPLVPRWALGNWWSRYHAYTAQEYTELMDRFAAEGLPFSVAVLDMDWHWVDIAPHHGSGWTGLSWNTDLFPDPDAFLADLRSRGLRVSLNLHPADGVRSFEDAYPALARRLGLDPEAGTPIPFAADDPEFMEAYFEEALHPLEDRGVDFWWIDWQQGTHSRTPGLDPLWLLNHLHFLDSGREGRRPITFSRYAGPGSHRYPVGFSGDTVTSWASLDFQPFFTATAANIGYGWWSHDIGGHMFGERSDEMVARWSQLGTFSPINRLHSTNSPFQGKEPWNFGVRARAVMSESLRLRHRLVPYLYTMNERAHRLGEPLVRPLYHEDPRQETVWASRNTFLFGTQLLVAPITAPASPRTDRASVTTWLPEGTWTDVFTGVRYSGGRFVTLHRPLEEYPVLARAGAILPLVDGEDLSTDNPDALEVRVFPGADGAFELYEDDGAGDPVTCRTPLAWDDAARVLTIGPVGGEASVLPAQRRWRVSVGSASVDAGVVDPTVGARVELGEAMDAASEPTLDERLFALINDLQVGYVDKHVLWEFLQSTPTLGRRIAGLAALPIAEDIREIVSELLIADLPA